MEQENKIEKLVLTLSDKNNAIELKNDMIVAGVPKKNFETVLDDSNNCIMTINDVHEHLPKIINMFLKEPYKMSFEEISKLLNIQIV